MTTRRTDAWRASICEMSFQATKAVNASLAMNSGLLRSGCRLTISCDQGSMRQALVCDNSLANCGSCKRRNMLHGSCVCGNAKSS